MAEPRAWTFEPGRNCWRIERANRAALIVDAADYFALARKAMLRAERQILLIGWDFDTRISLDLSGPDDGAPDLLGPLLSWMAKHRAHVSINILKWDLGAPKLLGRGTTIFRLARWALTDQIDFKLDGAHPAGASHHQKIVVIDDRLAFCGGIDMTASRWDTREHADGDKRRKRPTTGRSYCPWHDATMAVDGDAARALGELSRERWKAASGKTLPAPEADSDPWPDGLEPMFEDLDVAIARTRGATKGILPAREIEAQFLDMVAGARSFVYAENQFFASRTVAEAIAKRLAERDGPEFVLVNPRRTEGWVEQEVMDPARARLMEMIARCPGRDRFRIYTPVSEAGEDIYVHAKITIVDDEMLRVGSANFNNRSMGLDSECDLTVGGPGADPGTSRRIAMIRCDLMAEHLGTKAERVQSKLEETGSLIATVEALRGEGRTLAPFEPEEPNAVERAIADSEALDPESAGEQFEPQARPGLAAGLRAFLGGRPLR